MITKKIIDSRKRNFLDLEIPLLFNKKMAKLRKHILELAETRNQFWSELLKALPSENLVI
jgi:hypothetical protein